MQLVMFRLKSIQTVSDFRGFAEAAGTFVGVVANSKMHASTTENYRICTSKPQKFFNSPSPRLI